MRPATKVIIGMTVILLVGLGSIVAGEYIRTGEFDMEAVKLKVKRADLELLRIIESPIKYFSK